MIDGIAGDKALSKLPNHIAVIGNSVPRRCGIATFTTDTVDALRARFPEMRVDLYAMDDGRDNLVYPAGVTTISQHDPASYIAAARAIRSEEHTSELQSLMRISYAVFCLKKNTKRMKTKYNIIRS